MSDEKQAERVVSKSDAQGHPSEWLHWLAEHGTVADFTDDDLLRVSAYVKQLEKAARYADSMLSLIVWRGHLTNWGGFGMCTKSEAEKAYQELRAAYERRR